MFSDAAAASKAVAAANGTVVKGHTLRVDGAGRTAFDAKRSVFLGNLATAVTEETVRAHFAKGLRGHESAAAAEGGGEGDGSAAAPASNRPLIEGVRIIRDSVTQEGKGFGYLLLKDRPLAAAALALDGTKLGGRPVRVQVCGKRFKGRRGEYAGQAGEGAAAAQGESSERKTKKEKKRKAGGGGSSGEEGEEGGGGGAGGARAGEMPSFAGQRASKPGLTSGAARRVKGKAGGSMGAPSGKGKGKGKGGRSGGKGGKGGKGGDGKGKGSSKGKGGKGKGSH